jgi:phenylpropionate dioxygenase-like ring-hydroxylating dioxygenase large terminal subunit
MTRSRAAKSALQQAQVERLLELGLRNFWYAVAPSWMVGRAPVGLTRLGERIVLWRGEDGGVHALEDRCPHRGARLALGWNLGDRLACWYHGIEIGADGTVLRVPAVEGCPLEGQRVVKSYPCVERHDAIFVWFGDALQAEPAALALPEELTSPAHAGFLCTAAWRCNYRYAIDNVMDPMHGAYLHAVSHSMGHGDKQAVMRIAKTAHGFRFEKVGQRGVNFDWTEWGETGTQWMRLAIPYGKEAGPGGPFTIVGCVTPVDARNCRVFFWRIRQVEGWQRDVWRFLFRTRLEGLHWDVLEQDRVLLESLAHDARDHEFLYQHDTGLARLRRQFHDAAERQVAALAAAEATARKTGAAAE